MRFTSIFKTILGVERTAITGGVIEADGTLVLQARPYARAAYRCPVCHHRCPKYDRGAGRRRWRTLDLGATKTYIEAACPRVRCREHGIRVAAVPWARPKSRYTKGFEQVARLATHTSKSAVQELMRITWRAVGTVVQLFVAAAIDQRVLLADLRAVSIDEKSYRKGHKYLTVVVNLETGTLEWAAPGRRKDVVHTFFDDLGEEGRAALELVAADGAAWITDVVAERCPHVTLCMDPFHVVKWMTDAVDSLRRELSRAHRTWGWFTAGKALKNTMWIPRKGNERLLPDERGRLAYLAKVNDELYRAYLLKELLRRVFMRGGVRGIALLNRWLVWARRSRIAQVTDVAAKITRRLPDIKAALLHGASTSRSEALNGRIDVIIRRAYGFHSAAAAIALAFLGLSVCPPLPGRSA